MTEVGASWGNRGAPFSFSRRAHLLTTCPQGRWWYCRVASDARSARRIALSSESARQCRRTCEQRSPLSALRERYTSPSACENLHPAALSQRQGKSKIIALLSLLRKRNRKTKNTEVKATGNIPHGSEGHQQRHGSIRLRSIGLYELFRNL